MKKNCGGTVNLAGGRCIIGGVMIGPLRFRLFPAAVLAGGVGLVGALAGGVGIDESRDGLRSGTGLHFANGAQSAIAGFAAVFLPAEWARALMTKVTPVGAVALVTFKFALTLAAVAVAIVALGGNLAPLSLMLGVVAALPICFLRMGVTTVAFIIKRHSHPPVEVKAGDDSPSAQTDSDSRNGFPLSRERIQGSPERTHDSPKRTPGEERE